MVAVIDAVGRVQAVLAGGATGRSVHELLYQQRLGELVLKIELVLFVRTKNCTLHRRKITRKLASVAIRNAS